MKFYKIEVEEAGTKKIRSHFTKKASFAEAASQAYELSHSFGTPSTWRVISVVEVLGKTNQK